MTSPRIAIELDHDEMHAWLRVLPGEPIDEAGLLLALDRAGVVFGRDADAIAAAAASLADPTFEGGRLELALGRAMQPASGGACALTLAVGLQAGHRLEDGSFDYRDRGLLTPVHSGQIVAHCQPELAGIDGCTVTGKTLPCARAPALPSEGFGDGLARSTRGDVIATQDGVLRRDDAGRLAVGDRYVHDGDVDIRSGHLEMCGHLEISGDVTAKFDAQATGDVVIAKSVLRGTVYAGGSVRVRAGVVGTGGGAVLAEHDVEAEHGQGATIDCGGLLHLRRAAINCELSAARVLVDGAVRGGHVRAEHEIVVGEAGARLGGEAELAVAELLVRPVRDRFDEERRGRAIADRIGAQVVHARRITRLLPGSPEATSHAEQVRALAHDARIEVRGTIHAGCTVVIGGQRLVLDAAHRHVRFTIDAETHAIRMDALG
jgi:uncharacterized protein